MGMKETCRAAVAAALLTAASICGAEPAPQNLTYQVHMQAKPAVVRVYDGYAVQLRLPDGRKESRRMLASGSGFFVSSDGYILTNAHVVSRTRAGPDETLKEFKVQMLQAVAKKMGVSGTVENLKKIYDQLDSAGAVWETTARFNKVVLQDGTVLPYEIKTIGDPIGDAGASLEGKDVAVLKVEARNAPTLQLAESSKVKVGERVFVLGFPAAADSEALNKAAMAEPTTNEGAISAVKTSKDGIPIFQTNASATHGNSGGPVVNDRGEVLGLLTFGGNRVNDQEIQGFNFVVPSNTAREFVVSSGAAAVPGVVDQRWREGLEQYGQGRYRKAKTHFEEVTTLFPGHVEAKRLIGDAQERILKGEDKGDQTERLAYTVIGAAMIVIGTIVIVFVVMRKRRSGRTSMPAPAGTSRAGASPPPRPAPFQPDDTSVSKRPPGAEDATLVSLPRNGSLRITFREGPLKDHRAEIPAAGAYLGRDVTKSNLVVAHKEVSGRHLWIGQKNGGWCVIDQNSTNGTYVNDANQGRITERMLRPGDRIIMGPEGTASFVVG